MRRAVLGMSSLGALFAGMAASAAAAKASAENLGVELQRLAPRKRGKKRASSKRRYNTGSGDYQRRQMIKRRWLEGFPIPDDAREALEAAQVERERKNGLRARMIRRTGEGQLLADLYPVLGAEDYNRIEQLFIDDVPFGDEVYELAHGALG